MHPEFPALGEVAYLEHAHRAPLPERARRAVERALRAAGEGVLGKPALEQAAEEARANVARILGARPAEVSFTQNTTSALAAVAASIDWREGDRVVTNAGEWPSAIEAWRRPGVKVEVLPLAGERLDLGQVAEAAKGARVLSVASVALATGERRDLVRLARIAKDAGALLVVDAAQSVGVLETDVRALGVDALAACSRKWLLGPPEAGILYVREGAPFAPRPQGALAGPLLAGLAASTGWLLEVGMRRVEEAALARAHELRDRARAQGFETRGDGPIVRVLGALSGLDAHGVVAREGGGEVRFSPHFWNPPGDAEKAVLALLRSRPGR